MSKTSWEYLFEILSGKSINIPLEIIPEFRKIIREHKIEPFVDFVRGIKISNQYIENPWEWEYLKLLAENLPENIKIIVLKGAAARDLNLYQHPGLRQSEDLDIYVHHLKTLNEKTNFINVLSKKKIFSPERDWEYKLKQHNSITATYNENLIDIHFTLFNNMPLLSSVLEKDSIYSLTESIITRCTLFRNLKNIKKMSVEDFWLYCIFHFMVNYPKVQFNSILDSYILIKNNSQLISSIKEYSENSNQTFLYTMGLFLLNQIDTNIKPDKPDILIKRIYSLNLIFNQGNLSTKARFANCFSRSFLISKGNFLLFGLIMPFYLFINSFNNLFINSIEANVLSKTTILNILNKISYSIAKIKDKIKRLFIDLSKTNKQNSSNNIKIIQTEKELITLDIYGIKLTFEIPSEFKNNLNKIWHDFTSSDHLKEKITIENFESKNDINIYKMVYRNGQIYMQLSDSIRGEASIHSSGTLYAKTFWDVRTFALSMFRAISFETDDILIVHAGAVTLNEKTVIFPGGTGAGKTTLFNILTENGGIGINDDTILLKKENDTWYAYPTPFMSKLENPIKTQKKVLSAIIDPIKVSGGHEINSISKEKAMALVLNNTISDFTIDDGGYIWFKTAEKILSIAKQIDLCGELKYSLENNDSLKEIISKWINNPERKHSFGKTPIRLIEVIGNSMEPLYKEGDILMANEIHPLGIKSKDIICYAKDSDDFPIIHRVHYLIKHQKQTMLVSKGDNSIYYDEPQLFKNEQKVLKVLGKLSIKQS